MLGTEVSSLDMKETVDLITGWTEDGSRSLKHVVTANAEIIYSSYRDGEFRKVMEKAALITPDGAGVILAGRLLGKTFPQKVSGVELAAELFGTSFEKEISFYFLGGGPGIAELAAENLVKRYPRLKIAGIRDGYFSPEEEGDIVRQINESGADVLLVALGSPKQDYWIDRYRNRLTASVAIGVGGSLDIYAGIRKRAPRWMCNAGLEWLYRLLKEPHRFFRMFALPAFILAVLREKFRSGAA